MVLVDSEAAFQRECEWIASCATAYSKNLGEKKTGYNRPELWHSLTL